jgi:hypothetical protein
MTIRKEVTSHIEKFRAANGRGSTALANNALVDIISSLMVHIEQLELRFANLETSKPVVSEQVIHSEPTIEHNEPVMIIQPKNDDEVEDFEEVELTDDSELSIETIGQDGNTIVKQKGRGRPKGGIKW